MRISVIFCILTVLSAQVAHGAPVFLDSSGLCHMKVAGFKVQDVRVYAHLEDMKVLLSQATLLDAHSCSALLTGVDEPTYILEKNVEELPASNRFAGLSRGRVVVYTESAEQFIKLYEHVTRKLEPALGSAAPPPTEPPTGRSEPPMGAPSELDVSDCATEGEVCISSSGEYSFSVSCGALTYGVSTSGDISITGGGQMGGITLRIPGTGEGD